MCTFSLGTLDSVVSWAIHTLVCVVFADIPTNITFWKCFCILFKLTWGLNLSSYMTCKWLSAELKWCQFLSELNSAQW